MSRANRRKVRPRIEGLEERQLLSSCYLVNEYSGEVLEDPGSSTANGTKVDQYHLNGGANQQWNLNYLSNGNAEIINVASGKALDNPGFSTANGTAMQQYTLNGGTNQQWKVEWQTDGSYVLVNAASNKALDEPGWSAADGTVMQQYQVNGGANQRWRVMTTGVDPVRGPLYLMNAASGKALMDPWWSSQNGTQMIQGVYTPGPIDQWTIVPLAQGYDLIVNSQSGKVLDDPGYSGNNGTVMEQYQLNGGTNQLWKVTPLINGNYEIINDFTGKALDDPGFSPDAGTLIQQYTLNGGLNQQWSLYTPATGLSATSGIWSGYVAATNPNTPQSNTVTAVYGSWVVPRVTAAAGSYGYTSTWIGIDGWNTGTVEQLGTEQDIVNGQPVYKAWWEMYSDGKKQPSQGISSMTIQPGDTVTALIEYQTSGPNAGQYYMQITDNNRANDSFHTYQSSSATQSPLAQRATAEWVVEAPTFKNGAAKLADFGSVSFTNCAVSINGGYSPVSSDGFKTVAVNMTSGGVTEAMTSTLNRFNTGFTVEYNASVPGSNGVGGTTNGTTPDHGTPTGMMLHSTSKATGPAIEPHAPAVTPSHVHGPTRQAHAVADHLRAIRPIVMHPKAVDEALGEWRTMHGRFRGF
jgi:hypothetical protein